MWTNYENKATTEYSPYLYTGGRLAGKIFLSKIVKVFVTEENMHE